MEFVTRGSLQVHGTLAQFIEEEALPGTGVSREDFWAGLSTLVARFERGNRELLKVRRELQNKLNDWHRANRSREIDLGEYRAFLEEIGYLVPEPDDCRIETSNVDPEIATIPGPQLVVPVTNARFATNAVNARWNSLYDALYGSDVFGALPAAHGYDADRGGKVVAWVRQLLDDAFPLGAGSHLEATGYRVGEGRLAVEANGATFRLADEEQLVGYTGAPQSPDSIVLRKHGLHVEIQFDADHPVGRADKARVCDVQIEAAVTTIMDCEDSVAVVDAEDKALAYRNWMGVLKGDLTAELVKNGRRITRRIREDREVLDPDGRPRTLKARALLLVRNTAPHVSTDMVRSPDCDTISEALLDALCTVMIALHDVRGDRRNSARGSVYVVKPKMHGPAEVEFCDQVFSCVEEILGLPQNTVKIGIMDEERRTTVNLAGCIAAARRRVAFINTGFLDRTGDEIHTSGEAGPFLRKADIKEAPWLSAYEDWNVDVGLRCGLSGSAQIGKGMWAMPDLMSDMLEVKIEHPQAGANTAWVPSPTAAALHATHYLRTDVLARQAELSRQGARADLDTILEIPLAGGNLWSSDELAQEVRNNLQGILGYVVRWVDQGIGCSKIPDINDVGLMEDRATCRISSQHIANWLHHEILSRDLVDQMMKEMAEVVDRQNSGDPDYRPMAPGFETEAYLAARELVFEGLDQPNGYTEPILHRWRQARKSAR
ncbi:MAG: malate synthase G [Rhodobacteraceae bacterium]|nr:malate synthase G [Paracoccaceae bacterium]